MELNIWLKMNKIKNKDFAKEIGVSPVSLCRWVKNKRSPHIKFLHKIEKITNGEVSARDFVNK